MTIGEALQQVSTQALAQELRRRTRVGKLDELVSTVAKYAGVTVDALVGPTKPQRIARPRLAGMALARESLGKTEAASAQAFGREHPACVRHAMRKTDPEFLKMKREIWAAYQARNNEKTQ